MFYLTIILLADLAAALAAGAPFGDSLFTAFYLTGAVILLDGTLAFAIRRLPARWFAPLSPLFTVSRAEARFYRRLRINRWKHLVPELGGFTAFHKDKLQSTADRDYLARFLLESNYGVAIHAANAVFGFLIPLLPRAAPVIAWVVSAVNAVLSILPLMILRANTRGLSALYRKSR